MKREDAHSPGVRQATRCSWVRERLGRYLGFELDEVEFCRVERHLGGCSACNEAYNALERQLNTGAAVDGAGAIFAVRAPHEAVLDHLHDLEDRRERFQSNFLTDVQETKLIDGVAAALERHDCAFEAESFHSDTDKFALSNILPWNRLRRHPLAAAAAALLIAPLPLAALIGPALFPAMWGGGEEKNVQVPLRTDLSGVVMDLDTTPRFATAENTLKDSSHAPDLPEDFQARLTAEAETTVAQLELAAVLPDTEEEYEAWAREEYPHIMALYDVLTAPGESGDGAEPLWDGVPVNIPPWGERLYADTPEDKRPQGWRAQLIYSGEIFKFDWPQTLVASNCTRTLQALEKAAAVSGAALKISERGAMSATKLSYVDADHGEHRFTLKPLIRDAVAWPLPTQQVPEAYVATLARDITRTRTALAYFATSSGLVQTISSDELSQSAVALLRDFSELRISECDVLARSLLLDDFLDNRRKWLDQTSAEVH